MTDGPPDVMSLAVDLYKNFVEVLAPVQIRSVTNAPHSDFRCKQWADPVPPEPYSLAANIDTAFEQEIFDLAERQRIADIHHRREADHLG